MESAENLWCTGSFIRLEQECVVVYANYGLKEDFIGFPNALH